MKTSNKVMLLCFVVLLYGITFNGASSVSAAETGGGQVSSSSKITFYNGQEEPKEKEPNKPKPPQKQKPGILPQTGNVRGNYSLIGFVVLGLSLVVWAVFKKRGKENES